MLQLYTATGRLGFSLPSGSSSVRQDSAAGGLHNPFCTLISSLVQVSLLPLHLSTPSPTAMGVEVTGTGL